jgi:hypothetical protein
MGRVLEFFPRQALTGNSSGNTDYYSEIIEVPDGATLQIEFRVYAN